MYLAGTACAQQRVQTVLRVCMQGVCVQVMGVPSDVYKDVGKSLAWPFPPTLFVHMRRDQRTAAAVTRDIAALKAEVRWQCRHLSNNPFINL